MASCGCHFQGTFDVLLPANVRKIKVKVILMLKEFLTSINNNGLALCFSIEERYNISHIIHAVNVELIHNSRLACIGCGHDDAFVMFGSCFDSYGQNTFYGLKFSIES